MPLSKKDDRAAGSSICDGDFFSVAFQSGEPRRLERLFSRRLIFVMGKGGVGKTTISLILAGIAEKLGKNALLAELGDTDTIGQIYLGKALSETPRQLTSRIWGARVDARSELTDYVRAHIGSGFIAAKIVNSRLFDYLFQATPGLKEVMSLGRLWRWENGESQIADTAFDVIIVDAPATGHAMSLLHLPDILIRMIRVGPLANQIRTLQRLLKDPEKTGLVLVSLPEELPVNEATEFYAMARNALGSPIHTTFINGVYPKFFNHAEYRQIQSLGQVFQNQPDAFENHLLASALKLTKNRSVQQTHIDDIYKKADGQIIELPFCFTNDLTLSDIQALSQWLYLQMKTPEAPVA